MRFKRGVEEKKCTRLDCGATYVIATDAGKFGEAHVVADGAAEGDAPGLEGGQAIARAKHSADRPTLIICKTHIGKGSPNRANTAKAHGEPLGAEEIKLTREALGWSSEPFVIPAEVYDLWSAKASGKQFETAWNQVFAAYQKAHPELAAEFLRRTSGQLPAQFDQIVVNADGIEDFAGNFLQNNQGAPITPTNPNIAGPFDTSLLYFTYIITDSSGGSSSATVTVTVSPTFTSLVSSCAYSFLVRITNFAYFGWRTRSTTATTAVLSILFDTTRPSRTLRVLRSLSVSAITCLPLPARSHAHGCGC